MNATHAYVGSLPCGCVVSICSDNPEHIEATAEWVSECIKSGQTIQRMEIEDARKSFEFCAEHKDGAAVESSTTEAERIGRE